MKKYIKNLLLKQNFEAKNIITLLEQLESCSTINIDYAINILIEGTTKRNLNIEKIQTEITEYYKTYYPEVIINFTRTRINELEDTIRVFFNRNDSNREDYYDLYNIDNYCNE